MPRPIVVDTNTLWRTDFAEWLRQRLGQKYVPAVVYAEAARFSVGKGQSASDLHQYLVKDLGLIVERMEHTHAQVAAELAHDDGDDLGLPDVCGSCGHKRGKGWHGRARDYMIAGHVARTGRILISQNIDDFKCLGTSVMPIEAAVTQL